MPGTRLKCTSPECDYETPNAPEFGQALSILQMHQENSHVSAIGNANTSHVEQRSKIWEPKELDLDPSECNEAAYLFWKSKFEDYLEETGTNDDRVKFKRLKAKLDLKVYEHIASIDTYKEAIANLDRLFIATKNLNATGNKLITTKQKEGQSVQSYLLRLQILARDCKFDLPASAEANRDEWVCQTFIAGLESSEMRLRLLEKKQSF